jgi:hypothetical protein
LLLSSSKPSLGVFQLAGHLLYIPTSTWLQKFLSPLSCIKEEAFTPSSPRHQWRSMYFVVMPRVNLIVILVTYARYLYSINCPTIICLPSMLLFILWRDTTSELWTPVQFPLHSYYCLLLLALFTFLHTTIAFHSICSILCLQQTGEIDNLIVS